MEAWWWSERHAVSKWARARSPIEAACILIMSLKLVPPPPNETLEELSDVERASIPPLYGVRTKVGAQRSGIKVETRQGILPSFLSMAATSAHVSAFVACPSSTDGKASVAE